MRALVTKIGGVLPGQNSLSISAIFYDEMKGIVDKEPIETGIELTFISLKELNDRINDILLRIAIDRGYPNFSLEDIIQVANNQVNPTELAEKLDILDAAVAEINDKI